MSTKPLYFVAEKNKGGPQTWNPATIDTALPHDLRYYGRVFTEMEKSLAVPDLRFYVTWSNEQLPEYGQNIVALLLGEEVGLMPRYARHVRAVIKTMEGTSPELGNPRWWSLDKLSLLLWVKYFRNLVYSRRSHVEEHEFSRRVQPIRSEPLIIAAPLGYALLEDIPMKKMSERSFHCFYAGNTSGYFAGMGLRKQLGTPKQIARNEMWQALKKLIEKRPDFKFDGNATDSSTTVASHRSYSERMMDSKICLAPRGSSIHSWRFFEGVKSGCLVVADRLPKRHYYEDAPVIEVDRWSQLEKKIAPYLEDETLLEQAQIRTLAYWEKKCGEAAIGSYIARCLNEDRLS